VDFSDGFDDDGGEIGAPTVNAPASTADGVVAVNEKSQYSSSNMSSGVSASQFLGSKNKNIISLTTTTTEAPAVSDGSSDDTDHHDVEDAGNGNSQHSNSNGTVAEQLLHVQLAALKQENEALHTALSHSTASAASLDTELAKVENSRAEAEAKLKGSVDFGKQEHDALDAMAIKLRLSEAHRVAELKEAQSQRHSLEGNLSATRNHSFEMQNRLQEAIDMGKAALSAAEKQEAALTAGLQKARGAEDKYRHKTIALAKSVVQLRQANVKLKGILRQRVQQLHQSETLRLRAEGAAENAEKEAARLANRKGSEEWFEEQVAALRAGLGNATRDAKLSREARDTEQSLLEASNRDRKNLTSKLMALNRSDAQHIHWLTAALAESKAQTENQATNSTTAWEVAARLRSTLKDAEQRRQAAEHTAQESANRSAVTKQFADAEVQRAAKDTQDAELAAGKAVTKAASAESQITELRQELQSATQERDELKSHQKEELQSAQDLASEVHRLRADLADSKGRLARSEQHAATSQAQFDAVGDLGVAKNSTGTSHASQDGKKHAKQSTRDKMRLSLSLIATSATDEASSGESEDKDQSKDHAAIKKGDLDRLQALLS